MINVVVLTGRMTKDPDLRKTGTGRSVLSFTLAVNRRFTGQDGKDTDFVNCVAWGKTAETMANYLHRGSLIGVEGRIQTRNYENQQGQRVYVTEVVADNFTFLESRNAKAPAGFNNDYNQGNPYQANPYGQPSAPYGGNNYGSNGYNNFSQPAPEPAASPFSTSMNTSLDAAFEDDTFDIDDDDLPF